jgi:hypothetical protein
MDASEEINKQRSLVEKINLVANVIANNSRRSGASYMVSTKYIYDALFPDKQEKRIKKINRILNSKI